MYMTPADMLATRLQGSVRQQLLGNGFTCDMRPLALSQNGTKPIITGKGPRAPDKHFSLRALWPQTENFRGTKRQFRGTHRKSTWQTNIHISPNFHCITNKYFDNRCRKCIVLFQIQFHIYCDSHLSQRFLRGHVFDEHRTAPAYSSYCLTGRYASSLPACLSIENAIAGAANASRVKSPLWHPNPAWVRVGSLYQFIAGLVGCGM